MIDPTNDVFEYTENGEEPVELGLDHLDIVQTSYTGYNTDINLKFLIMKMEFLNEPRVDNVHKYTMNLSITPKFGIYSQINITYIIPPVEPPNYKVVVVENDVISVYESGDLNVFTDDVNLVAESDFTTPSDISFGGYSTNINSLIQYSLAEE